MRPTPTFIGNRVTVGDRSWAVQHPVADARRIGDRIVVIYDYRCGPIDSAFNNVEAFDDGGRRLWTIENPGTGAANAYVELMSEAPLILANFAGFRCTIDEETGRLRSAVFTK